MRDYAGLVDALKTLKMVFGRVNNMVKNPR